MLFLRKFILFLLPTFSVSSSFSSAINESIYEEMSREQLQGYADQLANYESFLDARLRGKRIVIKHPEIRESLTARIMDGEWRETDYGKEMKDHDNFKAQLACSQKILPSLWDRLQNSDTPAAIALLGKHEDGKYSQLVNTHEGIRVLFKELVTYAKVDFSRTSEGMYLDGSPARGELLKLAAHEIWKQSVICHLKCSVYMHQLLKSELPNLLASNRDGFFADRTIAIPLLSDGRSNTLPITLRGIIGGKTIQKKHSFVYDTGATHTSIARSLLESWGADLSSLSWHGTSYTASGEARSSTLRNVYLQLHPCVIFNLDISVIDGGQSALLGMDIIKKMVDVKSSGGVFTLIAKENK